MTTATRLRSLAVSIAVLFGVPIAVAQDVKLLNVSYDATRELYSELNTAFADAYKADTGKTIDVAQSHGGSGKQARAVIDGLKADVLTPSLSYDVTGVEKAGLIKAGWQDRLPYNSSPYTSTIVFLVRKGNPKHILDWDDLAKPGVQGLAPNPKTGGGSRWIFLAAWGYAAHAEGRDLSDPKALEAAIAAGKTAKDFPAYDDAKAKVFVAAVYHNMPVLDSGARGSAVSFAQKGIGDVLVSWETEAKLAIDEYGADKFEIVYPSVSILAEPVVAVVDAVVDERHTREPAEAYLKFLFTPAAQEIIAANGFRPRDAAVAKAHAGQLPPIKLFTIDEVFGGWARAQKAFFVDGAVFDQMYKAAK